MQEQNCNIRKSIDQMSVQSFHSKNSSFTKYRGQNDSIINLSSKSMSIEGSGHDDLLKKLSSSDNAKIQVQTSIDIRSSGQRNKIKMFDNSDSREDNKKLPMTNLLGEEINNDALFKSDKPTHNCTCKQMNSLKYCPQFCDCYDAQEPCSKTLCCTHCFEVKTGKMQEILLNLEQQKHQSIKNGLRPNGNNLKKSNDVDVGIYIEGSKKPPKKFRQERCECRNSKCENKYCVCFTAGNKCTVQCLCQNCKNCDMSEKSQKSSSSASQKNIPKPYLEMGSNQSLHENMEFEPWNY